ncbi:hypothetical protein KIW84_055471 [Lathyrus oleraceus]|uniref:HECT domain-containing protein n=1 Tax=Pisum sativum TaxID=3888 RepID=A0A9D4WVS9_PEA|nr:hypothetical protein KIW84_055471 [Pisum sativum]
MLPLSWIFPPAYSIFTFVRWRSFILSANVTVHEDVNQLYQSLTIAIADAIKHSPFRDVCFRDCQGLYDLMAADESDAEFAALLELNSSDMHLKSMAFVPLRSRLFLNAMIDCKMPPSIFTKDDINRVFGPACQISLAVDKSQAVIESARANEILKQAAFLIPFTSRGKISTSQLAAARQIHGSHIVFTRNRFRIRCDHILEDAYNQMSQMPEDDLRGLIRVTFVNEFRVEEAGIDGGGIFKDFMENITRASFHVQYGLFKGTTDHLLLSESWIWNDT